MEDKKGLHKNNKHKKGYDFKFLKELYPKIREFVIEKFEKETIDFSDPIAIKEFNKALLSAHYNINYWEFPNENLCPPIPGRVDYIHHIADLIIGEEDSTILDIGTGSTCIYPLLGVASYNWNFVATDIDIDSLENAQDIIDNNNFTAKIQLRKQFDESNILTGITESNDSFSVTMCNPPFYKSVEDARGANRRKSRNLGNNTVRNFSGNSNELWYVGGEKAFLHTYLYESSLQPKLSKWFTSLVSIKDNVKSLQDSSIKLKVKEFRVIPMRQGNKVTRIVCWRF